MTVLRRRPLAAIGQQDGQEKHRIPHVVRTGAYHSAMPLVGEMIHSRDFPLCPIHTARKLGDFCVEVTMDTFLHDRWIP